MEPDENLGTRMMLENDRVRVWEHRVPSGGTGPMHLHRRPYLSVVVQGSTGETLGPDGDVLEHFELTPGYRSDNGSTTHNSLGFRGREFEREKAQNALHLLAYLH